jgi:hypothetical protein
LRLAVRAGIGLGITGASATGGLEIGGMLGIAGNAEAGVHLDWTPTSGLVIDAYGALHAEPKFRFDVSGYVSVRVLGFEVYGQRWELAAFEYGSDLRLGVRFPIHYAEGEPFEIDFAIAESASTVGGNVLGCEAVPIRGRACNHAAFRATPGGTMTDKTHLGRDVYVALAAVGWADGKLEQDEADAIVRAALEEGLELAEIEEIEAATKSPIDLGVIERKALSKEDRLYVYGVAAWIARLDGVVTDNETSVLSRLAESLRIPERPRSIVDKIVIDVAAQSESDRPARYDLAALRRIIADRLAAAQARREAEG